MGYIVERKEHAVSSWNRRVAAAARTREPSDPDLQADRLAELGLPRKLHPDDALAATTLLRIAAAREAGFEATLLGRVFGDEDDDQSRLVKIVVLANEHGATALVGNIDDGEDFDPLTGLPGRDFVLDAIDRALQDALNSEHRVGVFAIDVDRFKRVNDTHGYAAGDRTLRTLASELIAVLRPGDLLGRLGGDEYIVLCPDVLGVADAVAFGEQFRAVCAGTPIDSLLTGLTLSIGMTIGGPDRVAEDLLREAETALHQAKALGRDRGELFDDRLRSTSERRVTADQRLRRALDDHAIGVHFQPIVELATGTIVGAEALLRVDGDDEASLTPRELVRNAENSGLIRQIEEQVLEQAARTILALDQPGREPIHLSVNISDQRLNDSRYPLALARALHASGLPAELVRLEIPAQVLRGDTIGTRLVNQLKALGVRITIDEFDSHTDSHLIAAEGIALVKLSRDLVHRIHSANGRARAEMVIAELLDSHVDVCAVGVETAEDLAVVEELGCRYGQGYLFSPPVSGDRLIQLVADANPDQVQGSPGPSSIGGGVGSSSPPS